MSRREIEISADGVAHELDAGAGVVGVRVLLGAVQLHGSE